MIIYNKIGGNYNSTRHADPYIVQKIATLLSAKKAGTYLDIGCGTGNYLKSLNDMGISCYGVDPSEQMLSVARTACPASTFIQAKAENIPLQDHFFDGGLAVLTIHHWDNAAAGLKEVCRVLKPGGKLVLFTFSREQLAGYWLRHYFPCMIEKCMASAISVVEQTTMLLHSGFTCVAAEPYFVHELLEDHFLYSHKHRPEMYLVPEIRNNASGFRLNAGEDELKAGLQQLELDIATGAIHDIIKNYENEMGDYLFVTAQK